MSVHEDRICCDSMRLQVTHQCDQHPNQFECPDVLVIYTPRFDEFGIPIRDGGTSCLQIRFCPWCGGLLPASKRDIWFDELAKLGIKDSSGEEIPTPYRTDEWWRSRA